MEMRTSAACATGMGMSTQKQADERQLYWVMIISAAFAFIALTCNLLMKPPAWVSYMRGHLASRGSIMVLLTLLACILVSESVCRRAARLLAGRVRRPV
jgi:hypothetical protein